jgi:hypothetical protein
MCIGRSPANFRAFYYQNECPGNYEKLSTVLPKKSMLKLLYLLQIARAGFLENLPS